MKNALQLWKTFGLTAMIAIAPIALAQNLPAGVGGYWKITKMYPKKPIAAPGYRLDVLWLFRRVPENPPQGPDGDIDGVVKIDRRVIGPKLVPDLLASQYSTVSLD